MGAHWHTEQQFVSIKDVLVATVGRSSAALISFFDLSIWLFSTVIKRPNTWKSHGYRSGLYWKWCSTFQCKEHSMSQTVWATWGWALLFRILTSFVSSLGCFLLIAVFHSTVSWYEVRWTPESVVLVDPVWTDYLHFTWTLFPSALMNPFCVTAHGRLLVCHAQATYSPVTCQIQYQYWEQI